MTLAVRWPRPIGETTTSSPPKSPTEARRRQREWRREVALLGLVLLGIAVFFIGYATGRHDDTFRTNWYSPLRGTGAAPQTFGSVQGGPIDSSSNTPLLVTVRGLPVLKGREHYVLYLIDAKHQASPCGAFAVGKGTTRVKLSFPGLPDEPRGWKIAREKTSAAGLGEVVAQTPRR
jgi:hypothetical protein